MSNKEKQKQLILEGKLPSVMWQLSWPAILAMVLYGLNNFLDGVFVGQLINETALAGVGIAYPLSQISVGIGSLIGTGAGSALSIWIGSNDEHKLNRLLGSANGLSLLLSVAFILPAYIFAEPLVKMMGGTGDILLYATSYFRVTLFGSVFVVHGIALNMIIRGEGKMKTAAWMMGIGLALDVALKPIFISTMGWGVAGAAWATNVGMLVYSILGLWYFGSGKSTFNTQWKSFTIPKEIATQVLSLGAPAFIIVCMGLVQNIVVFNAITKHGTDADVAFFSAANRTLLFMMTPMFGLMRALQPVAGMNFGALQYDRVKKSYMLFCKTGFYFVAPFWLLMTIFPEVTLNTMLPGFSWSDSQLFDFRIYILVLPFLPIVFMALSLFPAIDKPRPASVLALLRQLIFYIPVMMIVPAYAGVRGVFWASTFIDVIIVVLTAFFILREFRRLSATTQTQIVNDPITANG